MRNLSEKAAVACVYGFGPLISCLGGPYVVLSSLGSLFGLFIAVAIPLFIWAPIGIFSVLVGGPIAILSLPVTLPAVLIISAVSILLLPLLPLLPMVALILQFPVQVLALGCFSLCEVFFLWPPFCAVTFYYASAFLLSTVHLSLVLSIVKTGPRLWRDLSRSVPSKIDSFVHSVGVSFLKHISARTRVFSHFALKKIHKTISYRIPVSDVLLHRLV
jgi:hypothetical protein